MQKNEFVYFSEPQQPIFARERKGKKKSRILWIREMFLGIVLDYLPYS